MSNNDLVKQTISNKEKKANIATYFLLCCIIFVLPGVIRSISHPAYPMIYIRPALCVVVLAINYFILINKYFYNKKHIWKFVTYNALIIFFAVLILAYPIINQLLFNHESFCRNEIPKYAHHFKMNPYLKLVHSFLCDTILLILTIGLSLALRLSNKWHKLNSLQKEIELNNLKEQINPHFLFNTLNNIYALVEVSPDKAKNAIHELSNLLRYSLYDNGSNTCSTIKKEVDLINNYIELMRLRLTSNVEIKCDYNIKDEELLIAPLLLLTLVENAFKHGVSNAEQSYIHIYVTTTDNRIDCLVENSNHARTNPESGIGLTNLRKRLKLIYSNNAVLDIEDLTDKFSAKLAITTKKTKQVP